MLCQHQLCCFGWDLIPADKFNFEIICLFIIHVIQYVMMEFDIICKSKTGWNLKGVKKKSQNVFLQSSSFFDSYFYVYD